MIFFLNLPFGETMAEQLPSTYYQTPYKFNGKELDAETGLYYYGARYYDPRISIWLSVDPLAEETFSSYGYCNNNPINLIDPTGMSSQIVRNGGTSGTDPKPDWLLRALKGMSAHRALTQYMQRIDPEQNTWRANKAVNAPHDITRPDLVYNGGNVGGVFELKPAPPASSAVLAAPEAKFYAKALNGGDSDGKFQPGTSGGAPSPFISGTPMVDNVTGNMFIITIPVPENGAMFWTEIPNKQRERDPSKVPVLIPIPQSIRDPFRVPIPVPSNAALYKTAAAATLMIILKVLDAAAARVMPPMMNSTLPFMMDSPQNNFQPEMQ